MGFVKLLIVLSLFTFAMAQDSEQVDSTAPSKEVQFVNEYKFDSLEYKPSKNYFGDQHQKSYFTQSSPPVFYDWQESIRYLPEFWDKVPELLKPLEPFEPICVVEQKDPLEEYSNSSEVEKMIKALKKNSKKCIGTYDKLKDEIQAGVCVCKKKEYGGYDMNSCTKKSYKSIGYCYRYVKYGLRSGGMTNGLYLKGLHAKNSDWHLKDVGFENLLEKEEYKDLTSKTAPKGAVLVYSGGTSGHIEIKTGEDEYMSDFIHDEPIDAYLKTRKLIGVYIKPVKESE